VTVWRSGKGFIVMQKPSESLGCDGVTINDDLFQLLRKKKEREREREEGEKELGWKDRHDRHIVTWPVASAR
jgi:hypothetical protein